MRRTAVASVLLIAVALGGCLSSTSDVGDDRDPSDPSDPTGLVDQPLWNHAQTFPHPDYGWPTVTNPQEDPANPWLAPINATELPDEISGIEHHGGVGEQAQAGAGIAIVGSLAVVPAFEFETAIFDISDPSNPTKLSTIDDVGRDVDTIVYPDGRIVAVFATDTGVVPVWDLTDPTDPHRIGELEPTDGSHNVAVVPGTPLLYNANSNGGKTDDAALDPSNGEGITGIYDLSPAHLANASDNETSLQNATHVTDYGNGYGCHDISFFVTEDKQRAYCAGIEYTQIWDISDPLHPEIVVNVPVHHGMTDLPSLSASSARFSHLAIVDQDADTLIVGDETGGGLAPACDAHAQAQGVSASGPSGNLYFYDISDEESPELQGWISPSNHYPDNPPHDDRLLLGTFPAGCTAHFGRIIPQADRDLVAMAFYGAGVTIVDFTDPSNPVFVDRWHDNTNVWDVWYYNGYLVTGDLTRGLDTFTLT